MPLAIRVSRTVPTEGDGDGESDGGGVGGIDGGGSHKPQVFWHFSFFLAG